MLDRKPIFDAVRAVLAARFRVPVAEVRFDAQEVRTIDAGIDRGLLPPPVPVAPVAPPQRPRRALGARGRALIHSFESLALSTYKDPGSKNGLPITGGWGSTLDENGKPFKLGFSAPKSYWDALFDAQIAKYAAEVDRLLGDAPTTQEQFDAMVSLCYNIGVGSANPLKPGGFTRSSVLRLHKAGKFKDAARAFVLWNKNDGKVMRGLTRRRLAESDLYLDA